MEQVTAEQNHASQPESRGEAHETASARVEELLSQAVRSLRKPVIGAGVAGVTVLTAGVIWGAAEAAVAGLAAWAVFRSLKKRMAKRAAAEPAESPI